MLKFAKWLAHSVGSLVGGFWLMILYVLTIWVSVGSLTAIQVRSEFQTADRTFSFDNVQRAQEKLDGQIEAINRRVDSLNTISRIYYDMEQKLRQVQAMIGAEEDYVDVWQSALRPEFVAVQTRCQVAPETAATPGLCDVIGDYETLAVEADKIERQGFDPHEKLRAEARSQIEKLQKAEPLFKYFPTYAFFNDWNYQTFLHVPHKVLVLLLTMAMGMLGSVVTMTWLFIRQDTGMTVRRFLILPFIGSMSAFVIYIFLSAGQLTLTAGDTSDALNPFVLSFVGIISGLLSERAYNRIADVGSNFFKVDDGQPRWALNLKAAMEEAGVTTAELALHLDTSEEEAGRIVGEATTATLPQQRLIAACLRRNLRELFTDVPPDGPAAQAAAERVPVPDVTGLDEAAARAALSQAGLELGERTEVADATRAPGTVIGQSLPAQSRAARGAAVAITLAVRPANGAAPPEGDAG